MEGGREREGGKEGGGEGGEEIRTVSFRYETSPGIPKTLPLPKVSSFE